MRRKRLIAVLFIFVIAILSVPVIAAKDKDIESEKELGKKTAADTDKVLKFVKDEKYNKRVEPILQKISSVAKTTKVKATYGSDRLADFDYTFKIVDDASVNAASLPAGYIYINKGLMDKVASDDELAGVIAHEVAHAAHHHVVQLLKKQGQFTPYLYALLAAALLSHSDDLENVYMGVSMLGTSQMSEYSQVAEEDADKTAIEYMIKANYNPIGMLTFIEKLAREDAYNPVDYGVYMNHPYSKARADYLIAELKKRNIPINRRAVTNTMIAAAKETSIGEKKVFQVVVDGRVIFDAADTPNATSANRAKSIADKLNQMFDTNPEIRDVKLGSADTSVYIKDQLIVDIQQDDADLKSTSREALAAAVKDAIQAVLLSEDLNLMY
ncbi:MAG: M48 family metalloprotease [Armatimonadota bacterium]